MNFFKRALFTVLLTLLSNIIFSQTTTISDLLYFNGSNSLNTSTNYGQILSYNWGSLQIASRSNANDKHISFHTGLGAIERMRLTSNGFFGIGTTTPSNRLHVKVDNGSLGFDQAIRVQTNSGNYTSGRGGGLIMQNADVVTGGVFGIREHASWHGALTFYTHTSSSGNTFSTTFTEKMRITHDGYVGIGTNSPSTKLHVEGGLLLDVFNNSGHENGIFFREGFTSTNKYNVSILAYDHNAGGVSPDGLSINAVDGISFSTGSNNRNERMRIAQNGNVGIGTLTPDYKLDVTGNARFTSHIMANTSIYLGSTNLARISTDGSNGLDINYGITGSFNYYSGTTSQFKIDSNGNVGIGTTSPSNKLEVNGTIRSKKVKVEAGPWPDYVFANGYQPMAISQLEAYIKKHKHLPEVPSAKEVEENGLDLGEMDATLLKKVEELTLYLIEKDRQVNSLEKENQELKRRLSKIEALIKNINSK